MKIHSTTPPRFKLTKYNLILALLCSIIIINGCSSGSSKKIDNTTSLTSTSLTDTPNEPVILTLKDRITNRIQSIDEDTDLTKMSLSEVKDFTIAIAVYKIYASQVKEGELSTDKEIRKLTKTLRLKLIAKQINNFPKLRKAYYKIVKNRLWEEDILVSLSGSRSTVLKFTGGYFAANINIKETQNTLSTILESLRFRQTQYKWYKDQDEYTYYTIDSEKDDTLAE